MPRKKSAAGSRKPAGRGAGQEKAKRLKGEEAKRRRGKRVDGKQRASRQPSSAFSLSPSPPARRTPSVAIVGAGRLGTALAAALAGRGYEVSALVSRRVSRARRAAELSGGGALALSFERLDELPPADLVFVTTPDDAIAETARLLASAPAFSSPTAAPSNPRAARRVVLHASGALSSDVLAPLAERGFAVGSLHPLVSVSDAGAGARSLAGAFYCVEGGAAASRAARRVVRALGGRSFTVAAEDKALYHAAAVIASGHTVALFDAAARLLGRCGLAEGRAREVLLPLLGSTLANLSAHAPARALTGTFARADVATVRKHLAALAATGDDESAAVYKLLGRRSLRLAREAGADARAAEEIARLLGDGR